MCGQWWTMADSKIKLGDEVFCPRCAANHSVFEIEIGEDKLETKD